MGIYYAPPQPTQGLRSVVPSKLLDNPPFGLPSPSLGIILRAWQPGPGTVQRRLGVPQEAVVTSDNPPFGSPARVFWQILSLWQPGPPQPWMGWRVNPALEAVREDNPPFGSRAPLWQILQAWQPGPPLPPTGMHGVPSLFEPIVTLLDEAGARQQQMAQWQGRRMSFF